MLANEAENRAVPKRVLVSGSNGFLASHTVARLLARGHEVVGTVRDPTDQVRNSHLLALAGATGRLTLVAADLTAADPFSAHADVDAILHMASPYLLDTGDPQRDLVDPAVKGTRSILEAASKSPRVRRAIVTSSMSAVTDEPEERLLSEADWNTKSSLRRNPYYFSKVLAERAAWEFMERTRPSFDLVVINPSLVIGPSFTPEVNTSNRLFVNLLNGSTPAVMAIAWGVVDVRDVADTHIAALERPSASGRYVCCSATVTMAQAVDLARANGFGSARLPRRRLDGPFGTWLLRLASYTQPGGTGSYLRTNLGRVPRYDNAKARRELGIDFRPPAESIKDTLADLVKWGHIKPPEGVATA